MPARQARIEEEKPSAWAVLVFALSSLAMLAAVGLLWLDVAV